MKLIETEEEQLRVTDHAPAPAPELAETEQLIQPTPAPSLTEAQMGEIAARLASKIGLVQQAAERELQALDGATLTAFLTRERKLRTQKMRRAGFAFGGVIALTVILMALFHGINVAIYYGAFSGMVASAASFSRSYQAGVMALTRFENPESVGELIPALEILDVDVRRAVQTALLRLLPRLRASDRKVMTEASRSTLIRYMQGKIRTRRRHRRVDPGTDKQLVLAILNALQQVGDNGFRGVVSDLAAGNGLGEDPEIAAAAQECLPFLALRTRENTDSRMLVRASDAGSIVGANMLVRAVTEEVDHHPDELLRAQPSEPAG